MIFQGKGSITIEPGHPSGGLRVIGSGFGWSPFPLGNPGVILTWELRRRECSQAVPINLGSTYAWREPFRLRAQSCRTSAQTSTRSIR